VRELVIASYDGVRAYLLSVRGELRGLGATTNSLVGGLDGGADELFSRADNGVDLIEMERGAVMSNQVCESRR
jgi:hypothetical protein